MHISFWAWERMRFATHLLPLSVGTGGLVLMVLMVLTVRGFRHSPN